MKQLYIFLALALLASACNGAAATVTASPQAAAVDTEIPTAIATSTATLQPSQTPTSSPTITLTPTETLTPTPKPTPFGGGNGYVMLWSDVSVYKVSLKDTTDYNFIVHILELITKLELKDFSSLRTDSISPRGDIVAFWNCATKYCDTERGKLYLFTTSFSRKATLDVPGYPYFVGWSADQERLLYYLGSTMADDFYLAKTGTLGFGEVIKLGKYSDMTWAPDGQTIYAQKGDTVYQLDKDGQELSTWTCNFNNACMNAISPDGKRFAGIQKHVPTAQGNPVITVSNADFTEEKSIFISQDKALILALRWLPDSRHLVVIGLTTAQRTRRFLRLDYLSIIDVESSEERLLALDIPEDAESLGFCGMTPDGTHLVYLLVGGRVKQEGRLLMSGRYSVLVPINLDANEASQAPLQLTRLTSFEDDAWESCPVWLPAKK